jgi:predicted metal-binding membrane protein
MSAAAVPVVTGLPAGASRRRLPIAIPLAIVAAWAVSLLAEATGAAALLHHDSLVHRGLPLWAILGITALTWPVMVAAMMLPSSVPMIRLFATISTAQTDRGRVLASFVAAYGLVWTAFGVAAMAGDTVLHHLVDSTPYLDAHPWLIGGGVLILAGAFQFTALKDACLEQCRHPAAFLLPRYRRAPAAGFRLGLAHGLFCLGCCWALMLVLFAAGVAEVAWMAALGTVMIAEKLNWGRRWLTPTVGVVLLVWAAVVIVHPHWLPSALASGA